MKQLSKEHKIILAWIAGIIILGLIGFYVTKALYKNGSEGEVADVGAPDQETGVPESAPDIRNASFSFNDGVLQRVTLEEGRYETADATVIVDDEHAGYGDIDGDGVEDTVATISANTGGTGTFIYLAALITFNGTEVSLPPVFLGDRIEPLSIGVSKGIITIAYLDREEDDAMAARPSVEKVKKFIVRKGMLTQL